MTTKAQLRKAASALPEVEERSQEGTLVFAVANKDFVSLTPSGSVHLTAPAEVADQIVARIPVAEPLVRSDKTEGVTVPLADINGMQLNSLVEKAWLANAPARLAEERRAARRGVAPAGPDALPTSIGRPATSALLAAGIKSLTDVATRTEAELLALHGVGPKAIRLLGEELRRRGLAFAER